MNDIAQLEKRLRGAIRRNRLILFLAGLTALVSACLALALVLSSIAAFMILPVPLKLGLMAAGLVGVGYVAYRYLYLPVRSEGDIISAAVRVEKNHPELKGRLIAALQLDRHDIRRTHFSPVLIELTGRQAMQMTSGIDFNEIVSGFPLWRTLRSGLPLAALVVVAALILPGFFSNAIDVYSQPTTVVAPPPGFGIDVVPGSAERVKYSDIDIGGNLIGTGFPDEVEIFYRFADGRWQSEKITLPGADKFSMNGNGGLRIDTIPFALTLKQVRRSFDYYVVAGDVRSGDFAIEIVERPRVTSLKLTVIYPAYTRLEPLTLDENNGSFAALVGSRVHMDITANRDIADGYLILDDSSRNVVDFDGPQGSTDLQIGEDFSYHIRLHDGGGEENPDPIEYMVTAIPDEYPYIEVRYPGFDLNLDERMMIPFTLHISDDFGFSSLALKYQVVSGGRKSEENVAVINFPSSIETDGEVTFNWDVDGFNLLPSDYILYHFDLADNDRVSGPKITSTRVYAARLPSIDEIVMQTETRQEGRVFESEKILREQREMAERLQQLAREMRASEKLDWQQTRELENILEQQKATAENLEKMANEMEKSVEELESNNLISEQIRDKMMELQKLFNEVATQEMKEAMQKLAEAMKNMSQDEIEQAMKEFQMSQEEMLKRLERSVALLKKMQIEQKMAAMLKMAEEMLLEQNRVNVETEQATDDGETDRLARREENLQKQMDALKDEADKLRDLLAESPMQSSEEHARFAQAVEENTAGEDMAQMQQALQAEQRDEALPPGRQASEKLGDLVSEMQQIIETTAGAQGEKMAQEIRKAIDDSNYLSREQERIYGTCQQNTRRGDIIKNLAAEQLLLREAVGGLTQRINELARQSPFLAAEIRSYLEQSQRHMQGSCDNLGDRRGRLSLDQQRDALYNLNRAQVSLLDALENQSQCNKGGSCNKMSQKMQSMCQKQQKINEQTMNQCQNPGPRLSNEQRQAMKRLAGEQGTVRKSLEELQQEFGNRRELLGRLDALADEVKQIEEMLSDGQVGDELFDRQLRVYSRMLDVQKSLNRRDFTRERQAVSAQDILKASPGALEDAGLGRPETLQDKLNRYLQEGYPRQYEQQIKAYFKAISTMGQQPREN